MGAVEPMVVSVWLWIGTGVWLSHLLALRLWPQSSRLHNGAEATYGE